MKVRGCYAMRSTDSAHGAMLCSTIWCYVRGTNRAYDAMLLLYVCDARAWYLLRGTDGACDSTRRQRLSRAMRCPRRWRPSCARAPARFASSHPNACLFTS
eukprot:1510419-Rhodomonas_salina.3